MLQADISSATGIKELKRVFSRHLDLSEAFHKFRFIVIHKIVLGLSPTSLAFQLQLSTIDIDLKCSSRYTPLRWAVKRSDIDVIRILLSYNADIYVQIDRGFNVVNFSTMLKDPGISSLLIERAAALY